MLLGALRRISLMLLVVGGGTFVVSTLLALLAGASVRRTVAVSFYLVGSVLLIAGFFVGNRGVLRADSDSEHPGFLGLSRGRVRSATSTEQRESTRVSALVIGLGVVLLILGTFADNEHSLA